MVSINTMNKQDVLKKIRLFVLDMDGTFYLGEQMIEGALDFVHAVKEAGKEFLFFTNNSSKVGSDYIEKLKGMGCLIHKNQIMTSGDVTIEYVNANYPGKTVYLLGTPQLKQSFIDAGIILTDDMPDIVVVGFDKTLTYETLTKACTYIRNGAMFLATHLDVNCPMEDGFIPDCGAMCAAISLSTGQNPKYLGKPFPETVEMVLRVTGYEKAEVAFVGDRLYTDVAVGVNNGATGILVLSGETQKDDLVKSEVQPDAVFGSLKDMISYL